MRLRKATLVALGATATALALALAFGDTGSSKPAATDDEAAAWQPRVEIVSPRNGARQRSHAVVVRLEIENFRLAPNAFGEEPRLGEGNIRYSLNRVPDCVDPIKLMHAINSPLGNGRLVGASFDYPDHAGPNGILAERVGTAGSYAPGTRPVIFYHRLKPGFYRMIVNLAQNNGTTTPYHAVTNFEVLPRPGNEPTPCEEGKVPSVEAATRLR
jgi:hypothetical protein